MSRCDLGPPEARCIVSLRDKLVWVMPIYVFGRSAQSPILQVNYQIGAFQLGGGGRSGIIAQNQAGGSMHGENSI